MKVDCGSIRMDLGVEGWKEGRYKLREYISRWDEVKDFWIRMMYRREYI